MSEMMTEPKPGPAGGAAVAPEAPLSYGSYLEVAGLLELQRPRTEAHDELLFIVTHQAFEVWFACALHELEQVRAAMDEGRTGPARWGLRRVREMVRLWIVQMDVLGTMTPEGFNEFRGALGESSGFQSVQFRELEMISGLRDRRHLRLPGSTEAERERMNRRFTEPSLREAFAALLERQGLGADELFVPGLAPDELRELAEDLLDFDAAFHQWRYRHWLLVVRVLGAKPGTGGSAGAEFLRQTLGQWFFPELHDARAGAVPDVLADAGSEPDATGCPLGYGAAAS
ncbi:tryptophan 2,3-dioxygenase [Streptomyces rubellomurinus]|uniref:Tryptophan 2,3-dioxygenase family protein n=1 Tax=Streptomyces sp. Y1 TaxID=3238634 RepID=A0AB39TSZ9_9ACTN|nr:tryptophan 2,3-dioxygenase family protein [Streptomyces rubellomurinus]